MRKISYIMSFLDEEKEDVIFKDEERAINIFKKTDDALSLSQKIEFYDENNNLVSIKEMLMETK